MSGKKQFGIPDISKESKCQQKYDKSYLLIHIKRPSCIESIYSGTFQTNVRGIYGTWIRFAIYLKMLEIHTVSGTYRHIWQVTKYYMIAWTIQRLLCSSIIKLI